MSDETTSFDSRGGRQDDLALFLRIALGALLALSLAGALASARVSHDVGQAITVLLVGLPLLRLVWLLVRWIRKGDRRFTLLLLSLLSVVVAAAAVGFSS